MSGLPDRFNLDHLKKQAKDLIRRYRSGDPEAMAQFRHALPAAAGRSDDEIASLALRLHDAQSCLARSYGFASWADLRRYAEVQSASRHDRAARVLHWLRLTYSGEVGGTANRANPGVAVRMLAENPDLTADGPHLACAIGDEGALRQATKADPAWINRPGGPLQLPPLVAVTHIRACCRCRNFANACAAARDFCSRPAPTPTSESAIVGRRRPSPSRTTISRCPPSTGPPEGTTIRS
jgi:hypothetical protein